MRQCFEMLPHPLHVWFVELKASAEEKALAWQWLSNAEQARAKRYRFEDDASNFMLARAVLRRLLAAELEVSPADVALTYSDHGKPSLAGDDEGLRFNVSHTGAFAAFALVWGHEVGLDIERPRPMQDLAQIAKRFFHPLEHRDLTALAESRQPAAFFRTWVQKEAYIKALGRGMAIPLDSFIVSVDPEQPVAVFEAAGPFAPMQNWHMHEFLPAEGYVAAAAVACQACTPIVYPITSAGEIFQCDSQGPIRPGLGRDELSKATEPVREEQD